MFAEFTEFKSYILNHGINKRNEKLSFKKVWDDMTLKRRRYMMFWKLLGRMILCVYNKLVNCVRSFERVTGIPLLVKMEVADQKVREETKVLNKLEL